MAPEKVCLIVIDGWGLTEQTKGNAIHAASTPVMEELANKEAVSLAAHGRAVGLPSGLMGNSEVGHLNIGAGKVVYQDIVRINLAFEENTIASNAALVAAAKRPANRLHLLGLVSDGGVHGHIDHAKALLKTLKALGAPPAFLHFFSDGRDTRPTSGAMFMKDMLQYIDDLEYSSLATVMGRYYAMDRDQRWERIKIAYDGLLGGVGEKVSKEDLVSFVEAKYAEGITDEFLKPIIVNEEGLIQDGDTLIFFDFRSDRMREINEAIGVKPPFETEFIRKDLALTTMTQYNAAFPFPNLFPPVSNADVLAETLSKQNTPQLHVAETEKYAHVTFFFNGGLEEQWSGEDRVMVPSPKVATYDLQPTMNAVGVAEKMVEAIAAGNHPFIMCNFAPPDMVGHTGVYEATVQACAETDRCIGLILTACRAHGYVLLVTSDHGNAEQMLSESGGPHTAHTCNRVPFYMDGGDRKFQQYTDNMALCDVAPTVLALMELEKPDLMTGRSLLAEA